MNGGTHQNSLLVPDFDIRVNGAPLAAETRAHVLRVEVENDVNLAGMFSFMLAGSEGRGVGGGGAGASWLDDETFPVGGAVEISLGYADRLRTVIRGEITALEPEFSFDRLPALTVRGYDRRHRLQRGRRTRTFVSQKDSDIAARVAREAGLNSDAADSRVTHDYVLQANQTDMEFLRERAARIGFEVFVDDRVLRFRPAVGDAREAAVINLEDDLLEFFPRLSAAGHVSGVEVRGWDPKEQKPLVGKARGGDGGPRVGGARSAAALAGEAFGAAVSVHGDRPVGSQAEADQLAAARLGSAGLRLVTAEGACRGRADLTPGEVVRIEGLGRRFSGPYYLTSVGHRYLAERDYRTTFTAGRNAV